MQECINHYPVLHARIVYLLEFVLYFILLIIILSLLPDLIIMIRIGNDRHFDLNHVYDYNHNICQSQNRNLEYSLHEMKLSPLLGLYHFSSVTCSYIQG